jgi:hypothetical protein
MLKAAYTLLAKQTKTLGQFKVLLAFQFWVSASIPTDSNPAVLKRDG